MKKLIVIGLIFCALPALPQEFGEGGNVSTEESNGVKGEGGNTTAADVETRKKRDDKGIMDYMQFYPIGEDPSIRLMTSYRNEETILFEGRPYARFSFYNNFYKGMTNGKKHTYAAYLNFKGHLRMYTDNSLPVKTPSYPILIGTQHLFRLCDATVSEKREQRAKKRGEEAKPDVRFLGFSVESGHYSNGQPDCAFARGVPDGCAECDSIYDADATPDADLSTIFNRESGNFSTNLTEVVGNFRAYKLDGDEMTVRMHSVNLGFTYYHDYFLFLAPFGGFSDRDILIYGRWRFQAQYEFTRNITCGRIAAKQRFEWIEKPHGSVNPFRSETSFTYYPFNRIKAFGFVVSAIYGHDDYNFRFIDSGFQGAFGITWSQFPPLNIKRERGSSNP